MSIQPRPYQEKARAAVWDALAVRNEPAALVVLPTGMGKTVLFGLIARDWSRDRQGRVLVLAHREELIRQAKAELDPIVGHPAEVEMADEYARASDGTALFGSNVSPVVVASVPSLCRPDRLARFRPDEFGLVVTDEAHHATAASYRAIYNRFPAARLLGVTATPQRADRSALGAVFGRLAYSMGIRDAVDGGWLCPVVQEFVRVKDLDLSSVDTVSGDFAKGQLSHVLTGDRVLDRMVGATYDLCGDEPTLVFTAPRAAGDSVSQGEVFADALNKLKPESAVFLSGETARDVRQRELGLFEEGRRQYLIGCGLFTEGFNCPRISRVVMARPTKSVVYYTQAIGRGTRTLRGVLRPGMDTAEARKAAIAASSKPRVTVIDFVGNSGRHKLVSAVDIFAGDAPAEVAARAKKNAEKGGGATGKPVGEVLAEAAEQVRREEEQRERRRKEKARLRVDRVEMDRREVDPYSHTDTQGGKAVRSVGGSPATADQRQWVEKHGGVLAPNATAGEAGAMIADIKRRWKQGLCSPKQERVLKRAGLAAAAIPREHAKALLDYLAATQWRADARPSRDRLAIVKAEGGYRLAVKLADAVVPVGNVLAGPEQVREAYRGLCPEPVPAGS